MREAVVHLVTHDSAGKPFDTIRLLGEPGAVQAVMELKAERDALKALVADCQTCSDVLNGKGL
jgi:hypothetical protein